MRGYFVSGAGLIGRAQPGQTYIVVPSWGEDAAAIAAELERKDAWALVSAHHVFGNPRHTWAGDWARTRAWFQPIERSGRLLGVYVVDEPFHNGIAGGQASIEDAVAMVRGAGYRTMIAETYAMWRRFHYRPPVDFFGITGYEPDPFFRVQEAYADSKLNVVFGSASEPAKWCSPAMTASKVGCFLWSMDMGTADSGTGGRLQ
jgi:hypothetical protein